MVACDSNLKHVTCFRWQQQRVIRLSVENSGCPKVQELISSGPDPHTSVITLLAITGMLLYHYCDIKCVGLLVNYNNASFNSFMSYQLELCMLN